jgi:hypothetical protein
MTANLPASPGVNKKDPSTLNADSSMRALGFTIADYIYYSYQVLGSTDACANSAADLTIYTMRAIGSLDGDTVFSTFDLAVGTSGENELYHARGFNIVEETE